MKPTVYIDSMAGLRLLRGAQTVMQTQPQRASVAVALGLAVVAGGGIGLLASKPAQGANGSGAAAGGNCACVETSQADRC